MMIGIEVQIQMRTQMKKKKVMMRRWMFQDKGIGRE
jgi:hypothetical protein